MLGIQRALLSVLPAPEEKATYVNEMFTAIAGRYDVMNRLMTFGLDQGWRRWAARAIARPGASHALDVGTGTGDFLPIIEQAMPGALVVGVDFTLAMMVAGQAKIDARTERGAFINGDALELPFTDASFDAVSTGFAIRNVADIAQAFREMARVTRPGGRMACLEVARPRNPLVRWGHQFYFNNIVPIIGRVVGGNSRAYTYLPQSAGQFPPPPELARIIGQSGWRDVAWRTLGMGAVAVHTATRE
jgi:demethylmenaquinone methyltransferase/2-methoxy-6-polyprenyl-1,4-benzoquinol methylase